MIQAEWPAVNTLKPAYLRIGLSVLTQRSQSNEPTNQKFELKSKFNFVLRQQHNVKSITLFLISIKFYRTQNNLGPLNDHIIMEFSWVITMVTSPREPHALAWGPNSSKWSPAMPNTAILRWPVSSQWPPSIAVYLSYQITQNYFLDLCNMNE